jgi:hypothetical protein
VIVLPPMLAAQTASWHALMDLYERHPEGWTLVGGQMVHLHCAERDYSPTRPTDDADAVLDVRADPHFHESFTATLTDLGFTYQTTGEGLQHRWVKGDAQIDVLLPDGVGERPTSRPGAGGGPTLATPGGTQALHRSEAVAVTVAGHQGHVRRPNLVGALVMKAAAHSVGTDDRRHRLDFVVLATILAARDFREDPSSTGDRRRLRAMLAAVRKDNAVMLGNPDAAATLARLELAAGLTTSSSSSPS